MRSLHSFVQAIRQQAPVFVLLSLTLLWRSPCYAQQVEALEKQYATAQKYYQQGRIDSATHLLETAIASSHFSALYQGTKADIYKLLAFAYITLDRVYDAEKPIKKMLALRPFYKPLESDLMLFSASLDTLKATSLFSLGIRAGANVTFARRVGEAISVISSLDNPNLGDERYKVGYGYYLGLFFRYRIFQNIAIVFMPSLTNYVFNYQEDYDLQRVGKGDKIATKFSYNYKQNINYIEIPISINYSIVPKSRLRPFVSAGWFQSFLLSATKTSSATFITISQSFPNKENFVSTNSGYMVGFGLTYELNKFAFNIDARYKYGLTNLTNSNKRFANPEAALGFYDIPNDIKINNIELGFSLIYHLNFKVF
jgi:outer membrane protein W